MRELDQVIHAGLYYGVDSLKTKLCIEGRDMMYDFCARRDVPHINTKKWIVAQTDEQYQAALRTHEHAQVIGVPTRLVGRDEHNAGNPKCGLKQALWRVRRRESWIVIL